MIKREWIQLYANQTICLWFPFFLCHSRDYRDFTRLSTRCCRCQFSCVQSLELFFLLNFNSIYKFHFFRCFLFCFVWISFKTNYKMFWTLCVERTLSHKLRHMYESSMCIDNKTWVSMLSKHKNKFENCLCYGCVSVTVVVPCPALRTDLGVAHGHFLIGRSIEPATSLGPKAGRGSIIRTMY